MIGRKLNHYEILEPLGEGGMGQVWRARDSRLGREVAVKILAADRVGDEDLLARFEREAKVLATLNHPNIATIHEIGEANGTPFLVLELVEGRTLAERLKEGRLPLPEALDVARQVASALEAAHEKNIIHRDLKPSNVMLASRRHVKVLDFGIAKVLQGDDASEMATSALQELTATGALVGTAPYMSPEQIRNQGLDSRTDIWSFACLLFETLAGRRPFRRETVADTLAAIIEAEPDWRHLPAETPQELHVLLRRALHKDRERRSRDIYHLRLEIEEVLEGLRPSGHGEVSGPASGRPTGRHDAPGLPPGRQGTAVAPSGRQGAEGVTGPTGQRDGVTPVSGPLAEGERRQATVVVSTLAGFTAMVEQLPPAEMQEVVERLQDRAERLVEEGGGVLDSFADGEMTALFGVPAAHEDHAVRGVRAALELHAMVREVAGDLGRRLDEKLRARTAINSGLVVARPSDDGGRVRVTGATLQLAHRLASHAEADEVLVTPECLRLIAPFFDTEAHESVTFRDAYGRSSPYRVLGESRRQSRFAASEEAVHTAYTGRDKELALLGDLLAQARRGSGQFVNVVGDAGVGKSRLLYEFCRRCGDAAGEPLVVLQGRCQSFGERVPYLPFVEVLRDLLGIDPDAGPDESVQRLVREVEAIAPELGAFVPLYLHVLSVASEEHPLPRHLKGDDFRIAMREALSALFTLRSRLEPVVLVLEDWHWADEASKEALGQLAGMVSAYPILLAVTYRPEVSFNWGTPAGHTPIHLGPLEARESALIAQTVLGADELPEGLGALLHERTGGNPFFLEEICWALREEGFVAVEDGRIRLSGSLDELQLPDTIQAVLLTRLDRLDHRCREVLRLASVVGREFSRRILAHASGSDEGLTAVLEQLRELGLVQQTSVLPEPMYRFKHALTQDAAYDSLLRHQRRSLHGVVGEAIEAVSPERLEELADILAHHFSQAEKWERAVQYGWRSARKARSVSQFEEALGILDRVEEWLERLSDDSDQRQQIVDLLLEQERLCETLGLRERQQSIVSRLLEILEPGGDSRELAEAHLRRGSVCTLLGRHDEAETALAEALRIARDRQDIGQERNVVRGMGFLRWQQERLDEAIELSERALQLDERIEDRHGYAKDLVNLAVLVRAAGDRERGVRLAQEANRIGSELGDVALQTYSIHFLANNHRENNEYQRAREYFERALELSREHRLYLQESFHLIALANIHWDLGEADESLRCSREVLSLSEAIGYAEGQAVACRQLGERLLALGREDEARLHLQEGAALYLRLDDLAAAAEMSSRLGALDEHRQRWEEASAAWSKAVELRCRLADVGGEIEALEGLSRACRSLAPSRSLAHIDRAIELADRLGDNRKRGELLNTSGILAWKLGDHDKALAAYAAALEVFRELEDDVHVGLLLNSLGVTLGKLGRFEEAVRHLLEGLEKNRQTGERLLEGHTLAALGDIELELGKPDEALGHYQASLELRRAIGDRRGEGWMLHHLSRVCAAQGCGDLARGYATEAVSVAEEIGDEELETACRELQGVSQ